jgi:dihydroneopterin aldolase
MKKEDNANLPVPSFTKLQNIGLTAEDFDIKNENLRSRILIEDLKIYAYHGVLPEEKTIGTYYLVNAEVHADLRKAAQSDHLEDTINYAEINDIIHREMEISSLLLEGVIGRIIQKLEEKFPQITYIKIKLTKTNPPMQGEMKGVSVELEKAL